ncbi:MAG: 2-hydroxyacid dehydrogenase [Deltaproteobacteria bacterium]|nr:2-hydroxyacid dehydrogenase [Deltaproteobacteria bacterium]
MKKVLFITGQREEVAKIFCGKAPEGFAVSWQPYPLQDKTLLKEVEFLVLHPAAVSQEIMKEAKSLRLLQLLTAGYDEIDLKLAAELGIPVATNGGVNGWAVAEHSVAMLLALYRRLRESDQSVRKGTWRKPITGFNTFEVAGKTLGLIGAGNIGRKVARRFKSFETDILYYDVFPSAEIEKELGARRVSLEELLQKADIISLHLPLLKETRGLIGKQALSLMKPNAILLNASRGPIVDEKALVEALKAKQIAGAGLDVFEKEPIAPDNPLLELENVLLTPHSAGHSYEGWFRRSQFAWENIQRVAAGQKPLSLAIAEED